MVLRQERIDFEIQHQDQTIDLEDSEQVLDLNFPTRKNRSKGRHLGQDFLLSLYLRVDQ